MQTAKMGSSAAVVAGAITRAQAVATGHDLPLPRAARSPEHGRHTARVGSGLLAPAREMVERGERLRRHVRATPPCARPDEEGFLPHLPTVLAGLFDGVEIAFASGPLRGYALRAEALAATVLISGTGRWFASDGTAEGAGLVSLAMWREDVDVTVAVLVLRDLLGRTGAVAPAGGGA
jgi:hypothetical protein